MKIASLAVAGSYTLILVSPGPGQCAPCDALWAQLAAIANLPIEVTKVQVDDEAPKPRIFNEVRRLILDSMDVSDGSQISYPLGVMVDPNGVVVQATFGKPRIERKVQEVTKALSNQPLTTDSSSVTVIGTAAATAMPPRSTASLQRSESLSGVAVGLGVLTAGLSLVVISTAGIERANNRASAAGLCSNAGPCGSAPSVDAPQTRELRDVNTAAWVLAGSGAVVAAAAGTLLIYEHVGGEARVGVHAGVSPTGGGVSLEGRF